MRICLSMIVRNEALIIRRLLTSVLGFATEYCICDTGSTDDTVKIIQTFEGLTGRVYSDPFVNFEVSRTKALHEAQKSGADYILLLDADMILEVASDFDPVKELTLPVYSLYQESGCGLKYTNVRLVRSSARGCRYVGVTHEYFDSAGFEAGEVSKGLLIKDVGDGGSKSDKFERDIRLLEQGLRDDPSNVRYRFYLANSFFDTQKFETAIKHYNLRVQQGGWPEEVYYSLYRIALCYKGLAKDDEFLTAAIKAWRYRPTRAESIYEAMQYFQSKQNHKLVVALYGFIKDAPVPADKLFVSTHVYLHQALFQYSLAAFFAGIHTVPRYDVLMNSPHLDLNNQFNNYRFYYPVPCGTRADFCAVHEIDSEEFFASTPSILAVDEGRYLLNVRMVNYTILPSGEYKLKGSSITSLNKTLWLNKALEPLGPASYPETKGEGRDRGLQGSYYTYKGVEDVKLARIDGKTLFTGTVCLQSKQIGTCMGVYSEDVLEPKDFEPLQQCEKNWVFLPGQLSMIYQWHPLRFGSVQDGKISLTETRVMPRLFQQARGSTNGVEHAGEYWFVVHFVFHQPKELRYYFHALVVFDKAMNLKRYTLPFKFTRPSSIEYCLGIVVEKERVLLSYSVMDREAYVGVYAHNSFDWVNA